MDRKIVFVHLLNDYSGSPKVLSQVIDVAQRHNIDYELFVGNKKGEGFLSPFKSQSYFYKRSNHRILTLFSYLFSQVVLFFKILKYKDEDVYIYINTMLPFGAALAGKITGGKVIYHIHEISVSPNLLKRFLRFIIQKTATKVFFVSRAFMELEPFENIEQRVIYNSLSDLFMQDAKSFQYKFDREKFNVLMVCSMKQYKGVFEFIKIASACSKEKHIQFTLILNVKTDDEINRYFEKIKIPENITMLNVQKDIIPYYKQANLLLNLSRCDECVETFGLTIIEAMAFGIPAIVPPIGGPAEIVTDDREGYQISSCNIQEISQRIIGLSKDREKCMQLSKAAKKRSSFFSEEKFEEEIMAGLVDNLVSLEKLIGGGFEFTETISKKCVISIIDHVGRKAGMDYYSDSLATGLAKIGCDVAVYSNFVGLDTDRVSYFKCYDSHSNRGLIVKIWTFFSATFKASKEAKKRKSELVVMHLFSANMVTFLLFLIPKIFRLNIAVIAHDVSSFINGDNRFLQKIIYNVFANQIVVHNEFSKKMLLKSVGIKDSSKIAIIKHGGYIKHIKHRYTKNEARKELGLNEEGKYILFFGQIKRVKGLDILLKALKETSEDVKLIIAGKPQRDDIAYYDRLIDKLALQDRVIKIIRYIEDDEREKLFFAADVNVLPYRIIYQSGVLLMAMSYGLPVIASDLEPNKEVIRDNENGMFFKSGDAQSLSKRIKDFFDDNSMAKKIAENSVQTIKDKYCWDAIALQYKQLVPAK